MASKDETKPAAEVTADEQAAIETAVTPAPPEGRAKGEQAAEDRELKRQQEVVDAVAKANDDELPNLGGPLKEPGLGR